MTSAEATLILFRYKDKCRRAEVKINNEARLYLPSIKVEVLALAEEAGVCVVDWNPGKFTWSSFYLTNEGLKLYATRLHEL